MEFGAYRRMMQVIRSHTMSLVASRICQWAFHRSPSSSASSTSSRIQKFYASVDITVENFIQL